MNTTWYEKGRQEGMRSLLYPRLEDRFGPLSPQMQQHVQQMPDYRLTNFAKAIAQAASLRDLGLEE